MDVLSMWIGVLLGPLFTFLAALSALVAGQ